MAVPIILPPQKPEGWTKASWTEYWVASKQAASAFPLLASSQPPFYCLYMTRFSVVPRMYPITEHHGPWASVHRGLVRGGGHVSFLICCCQISFDSQMLSSYVR